jgi:hypothetical protein
VVLAFQECPCPGEAMNELLLLMAVADDELALYCWPVTIDFKNTQGSMMRDHRWRRFTPSGGGPDGGEIKRTAWQFRTPN